MKTTAKALRLILAAALAPACSVALAQDAAAKPGFSMKEDYPRTGTNIRRSTMSGGALPFDKSYAELSPEQQRMLKSRYEQMEEGDEPPYPVDGMGPLLQALSKANQAARGGLGVLSLEVMVDATGTPTKVEVLESPDAKLSQYAAHIAMLTRFKPALCKGTPCAMGFPVGMNFVRR
jgi:hypothetical protein